MKRRMKRMNILRSLAVLRSIRRVRLHQRISPRLEALRIAQSARNSLLWYVSTPGFAFTQLV